MLIKQVCLKCAEHHLSVPDNSYAGLNDVQKILFQYGRCYCIGQGCPTYSPTAVRNINNDIMTSLVVWLIVTATLPFLIYSGSWFMLVLFIIFQCVVLMMTVYVYQDVKHLEKNSVSLRSEPPEKCPYLLEHTVNKKK